MARISGVLTAMVTPFDADGAVDLAAARRLARHLVENGSHGLVVAGTTGEAPTLTDAEKLDLLSTVLDEVGDTATAICGTGANDDELGPIEGLDVLAGNDAIFLRCLEIGGTGGILVSSHLVGPEMRELYEAATSGDLDRAREIHERLVPMYDAAFVTSSPIPVKTGLELLGVLDANMRLPMVPASEEERTVVREALERHGLLVAGGTGEC